MRPLSPSFSLLFFSWIWSFHSLFFFFGFASSLLFFFFFANFYFSQDFAFSPNLSLVFSLPYRRKWNSAIYSLKSGLQSLDLNKMLRKRFEFLKDSEQIFIFWSHYWRFGTLFPLLYRFRTDFSVFRGFVGWRGWFGEIIAGVAGGSAMDAGYGH